MTNVITVADLKGGGGKTELVKELSKYLLERGNRVLVIDTVITYPAAFKYFKEDFPIFSNLTFINLSPDELSDLTDTLFKHFDYVVIDTMPYVRDLQTPITLSDMIVAPVPADSFTYNALAMLQKLVENNSTKVKKIDVATYSNYLKNSSKVEIIDSIKNIENIKILKSKLHWGKPEDSLDVLEELIEKEYIPN